MASSVSAESAIVARAQSLVPRLRAGERIAIVYFLYLGVLAWMRGLQIAPRLALFALPLVIIFLAVAESNRTRPLTRVVRDWLTMGLVLPAYWSIGWFAAPPITPWQDLWVSWDRTILNDWGFRAAVEFAGPLFPSIFETTYLILYAIPPICMGAIYAVGGRDRVHAFLFTLILGTFSAYALLPLIPVHGPHVVFPSLDLPNFNGFARSWNTWILDHADIPTSVFPSGHVAVAFSAAFGMLRAVRSRPRIWMPFFAVATIVYAATVYCRYHYAVDGLASIGVTALAWKFSERGGGIE